MLLLAFLLLTTATPNASNETPDRACAPCHRALYDRYRQTPMALGSGPTNHLDVPTVNYTHTPSRIHYTIDRAHAGPLELRFLRPAQGDQPILEGERPLPYFIGSGKRGRTFLFGSEGFWFQSPINFYAHSNTWEMAPGYAAVHTLSLNLTVDEGCLFCHTNGVQPAAPGTVNRFGEHPFTDSGITCARCHGDAAAHLASCGKAPVLNLGKLAATRRDAICVQCHLEGEVSVLLPNAILPVFSPATISSTPSPTSSMPPKAI